MVKHKLSGTGELDAIADSVEQLHPIFLFKLLYVLADGRLADEQFVGSLSETQECSHTSENFQSCIYHCMFLCYFQKSSSILYPVIQILCKDNANERNLVVIYNSSLAIISAHTFGKTSAFSVSSRVNP